MQTLLSLTYYAPDTRSSVNILTQKVPIHFIVFLPQVKYQSQNAQVFIFPRKSTHLFVQQLSFICFSLTQHGTRTPLTSLGSFYRFRRKNSFQLLDLKAQNISTRIKYSQLASCCIAIDILGAISQNSWGIRQLHVQEMKPWRSSPWFQRDFVECHFQYKLYRKMKSLKVWSARPFCKKNILPNGDNDNKAVLKESRNSFLTNI